MWQLARRCHIATISVHSVDVILNLVAAAAGVLPCCTQPRLVYLGDVYRTSSPCHLGGFMLPATGMVSGDWHVAAPAVVQTCLPMGGLCGAGRRGKRGRIRPGPRSRRQGWCVPMHPAHERCRRAKTRCSPACPQTPRAGHGTPRARTACSSCAATCRGVSRTSGVQQAVRQGE